MWNGETIAESNDTVVVEGNHYFPASALRPDVIVASAHHTTCPWKGVAHYYSLAVQGQENRDAVWYYPTPKAEAAHIAGRVAFWKGVQVTA